MNKQFDCFKYFEASLYLISLVLCLCQLLQQTDVSPNRLRFLSASLWLIIKWRSWLDLCTRSDWWDFFKIKVLAAAVHQINSFLGWNPINWCHQQTNPIEQHPPVFPVAQIQYQVHIISNQPKPYDWMVRYESMSMSKNSQKVGQV